MICITKLADYAFLFDIPWIYPFANVKVKAVDAISSGTLFVVSRVKNG